MGCDVPVLRPDLAHKEFQSTHPRGVRQSVIFGYDSEVISIHAPTWGATPFRGRLEPRSKFQSTHPRGVRPNHVAPPEMKLLFQSTHPRGVRRAEVRDAMSGKIISIHAPTWGATLSIPVYTPPSCYFNPRTHVGCDSLAIPKTKLSKISIHAPTWGATEDRRERRQKGEISIHAPTWGATNLQCCCAQATVISIHAPTWGAT